MGDWLNEEQQANGGPCPQCGAELAPDSEPDEDGGGHMFAAPIWRCPSCDFTDERKV